MRSVGVFACLSVLACAQPELSSVELEQLVSTRAGGVTLLEAPLFVSAHGEVTFQFRAAGDLAIQVEQPHTPATLELELSGSGGVLVSEVSTTPALAVDATTTGEEEYTLVVKNRSGDVLVGTLLIRAVSPPDPPVCANGNSEPLVRFLPDLGGDASRPRMFPTASGFDAFWRDGLDAAEQYVPVSPSGELLAEPVIVDSKVWYHAVALDQGRYAVVRLRPGTASGRDLAVFEQGSGSFSEIGSSVLPLNGRSHGDIALAWNPVAREIGVLYEESFDINPSNPGFVHSRLFFARLTEDGQYIGGSHVAITGPETSRTSGISDWFNGLIWTGDQFAAAWYEITDDRWHLQLGTLSPTGEASRVEVGSTTTSLSRPALAWNGAQFGVAWGEHDGDHYNMRFATVEDGRVSEHLHIGDDGLYTNEALLVARGQEFALAWDDSSTGLQLALIDPTTVSVEEHLLTNTGTPWGMHMTVRDCQLAVSFSQLNGSRGGFVLVD